MSDAPPTAALPRSGKVEAARIAIARYARERLHAQGSRSRHQAPVRYEACPRYPSASCLRGWIGFYDQVVFGWIADRSLKEIEVIEWSLRQLGHLAAEVLCVELERPAN